MPDTQVVRFERIRLCVSLDGFFFSFTPSYFRAAEAFCTFRHKIAYIVEICQYIHTYIHALLK